MRWAQIHPHGIASSDDDSQKGGLLFFKPLAQSQTLNRLINNKTGIQGTARDAAWAVNSGLLEKVQKPTLVDVEDVYFSNRDSIVF